MVCTLCSRPEEPLCSSPWYSPKSAAREGRPAEQTAQLMSAGCTAAHQRHAASAWYSPKSAWGGLRSRQPGHFTGRTYGSHAAAWCSPNLPLICFAAQTRWAIPSLAQQAGCPPDTELWPWSGPTSSSYASPIRESWCVLRKVQPGAAAVKEGSVERLLRASPAHYPRKPKIASKKLQR